MKSKIDGLALINSSYKNLEWWITNKSKNKVSEHDFKQILEIKQNFKIGIENIYRFKHLALAMKLDNDIPQLIKMDSEAHAIDFRIIHNPPMNGKINEGRITKANPYNLSLYEY